jgi:hypothetical protein
MKLHPLMVDVLKPFATVSDITECPRDNDYVIYNTSIPENRNRELLKKYTREIFNREISEDTLNELINCKTNIDKFIEKFREFINYKSDVEFDKDNYVVI